MNGCNHVQIESRTNKDLLRMYLIVLSKHKISGMNSDYGDS